MKCVYYHSIHHLLKKAGREGRMFKTQVVKSKIPLLWSRPAMSRAGTILDLTRNQANILGVWVNLNLTAVGLLTFCKKVRRRRRSVWRPCPRIPRRGKR